jgi:hypothetical protein
MPYRALRARTRKWGPGLAWMQYYISCERNDKGHVIRMSVTEHGANWLAAKQAEAS